MSLSDADLSLIAAGALTLAERLALAPSSFSPAAQGAGPRLAHWRRSLGSDHPGRLDLRLSMLGLSADRAGDYLGEVRPEALTSRPDWLAGVPLIAELLSSDLAPPLPAELAAIPFADLIWPLAQHSATVIASRTAAPPHMLSEQAWADVAGALVRILSTVLAPSLFLDFDLWRKQARNRGADAYTSFCAQFRRHGHRGFLTDYPVLARRLTVFYHNHITTTVQFLDRLAADLTALAAGPDLPVARLNLGLSDRHEGGAGVILIDFSSGRSIVYKPKALDSEVWFQDLAKTVGAALPIPGGLIDPSAWVIERAGYGWVSFAHHTSCDTSDQIDRYYLRAGALTALIHAINGYDFHDENIIAAGEWPCLIDFETLFNPAALATDGTGGPDYIAFSVTNTLLLTSWLKSMHGGSVDSGGLTAHLDDMVQSQPRLVHPNTPKMHWAIAPNPPKRGTNLPRLNGTPQELHDHLPAFLTGFRAALGHLRDFAQNPDHHPDLAALFQRAETITFRHILRNTRIYVTLLQASYLPEFNRSGIDLALHYEQLARVLFLNGGKADQADFVADEITALLAEDVPIFHRRNDGRDLTSRSSPPIRNFFGSTGIEAARQHLALLTDAALWRQEEVIKAAVFARLATPAQLAADAQGAALSPAKAGPFPELLLPMAVQIGQDILRRAHHTPDGQIHWLGAQPVEIHERYSVESFNTSAYAGKGGLALYLAALDQVAPDQGFGDTARQILTFGPKDLGRREEAEHLQIPIGGYAGVGSVIYTHLQVGRLLGDAPLVEAAVQIAGLLSDTHIAADTAYDVLNGSAGLILSLMTLAEATGQDQVLALAERAARHLMAARVDTPNGTAWPTVDGILHGGFAHGAAGIGAALVGLGHRLGREDFIACGQRAFAFQDSLWREDQANWHDTRRADGACTCPWCYGAVGTGFAHLRLAPHQSPDQQVQVIDRVTAALDRAPPAFVDHLCCGTAGAILFHRQAGQIDRAQALAAALAGTRGTVENLVCYPSGVVAPEIARPVFPGLMQGTAGIGYAFLAAARPDLPLPDVMTLSNPKGAPRHG